MTTTYGLLPVATVSPNNPKQSTITLIPVALAGCTGTITHQGAFQHASPNQNRVILPSNNSIVSPIQQNVQTTCFILSPNLTATPGSLPPSPTSSVSSTQSTPRTPALKRQRPGENTSVLRCKRRLDFTNIGYTMQKEKPQSVSKRNARERKRVELLNSGFQKLRDHIPTVDTENKKECSKIHTLKCAVRYIKHLQELLSEDSASTTDYSPDTSPYGLVSPTEYTARPDEASHCGLSPTGSMASSTSYISDDLSDDTGIFYQDDTEADLLDFVNWFD